MIPLLRLPVLPAESNSLIMQDTAENTARIPATSPIATEVHHMNRNETTYLVTMKLFQNMLNKRLITADAFGAFRLQNALIVPTAIDKDSDISE